MADQHEVTAMFNAIAPHYDFLNHLLSFRMDRRWRRKASKKITEHHPTAILDVATGTADLAIQLAHDNPNANITGIDLSQKMLDAGKKKITQLHLDQQIKLLSGNAESLPFPDRHFDAVTCAFGVRNFEHLSAGLREMIRVTKDDGAVIILEFSSPIHPRIKQPYRLYSRQFIPAAGRCISGHDTAYSYLPSSITSFTEGNLLEKEIEKAGAILQETVSLFGGIASLYVCLKKTSQSHNKETENLVKQL